MAEKGADTTRAASGDIPKDAPPTYEVAALQVSAPRPRGPVPLNLPVLVDLRSRRVVLASASPRRRALLAQIGLTQVEVIPSAFAEDLPKGNSPLDYVLDTATQKAITVYKQEVDNDEKDDPALIIAADTIVVTKDGHILEKPRSMNDHIDMLKMLRDCGAHNVYTAVACISPLETAIHPGYRLETHVEETTVKFDTNSKIISVTMIKLINRSY